MAVEIKEVALIIADISGYTRFVQEHDKAIIHAEQIISDLLEAVIASSDHPMQVCKIEGDAIFFYAETRGAPAEQVAKDVLTQALRFNEAFQIAQAHRINCSVCTCDACARADTLQLKVILHYGEAVFKTFRNFTDLAGSDVILVHRLLKNSVPAKRYMLMTERFYTLSGGVPGETAEMRAEQCEGIGEVQVAVFYPAGRDFTVVKATPKPRPVVLWNSAKLWIYTALRRLSVVQPARPRIRFR